MDPPGEATEGASLTSKVKQYPLIEPTENGLIWVVINLKRVKQISYKKISSLVKN
ncbi:hypothetical protein Hanom_Chr11g00993231 [Helianthus anomalus]